jgi:hypothetical protein
LLGFEGPRGQGFEGARLALKYHEGLILMMVQRFKIIVVVIMMLPAI